MRATAHRQVLTAIILAGGRARRMKEKDKAFLKIGKNRLIDLQLRALKKIFSRQAILNKSGIPPEAGKQIIIVTNNPKEYRNFKGVKVISDIIVHRGPLGGIFSGLLASKSFYNFVIACDMPFLNRALIEHLIKIKAHYDITIPKIKGKFHPLFGIYSKNCIPVIRKMLKENRLNVSSIFAKVKSHFIIKEEIEKFDPELFSLVNINTRDDLEAAKKIWQN